MKKIIILLLALQFSGFVIGQELNSFSVKFNHVALSVKDVNVSAEFYKNALKLEEITNRTEMDGIRWLSLGDGKELHLVSLLKDEVKINKAVHFALSTSEFDSFISELDKMKIEYSDWPGIPNKITDRAEGIKQVYFQDPDGYWIEVNSVIQE